MVSAAGRKVENWGEKFTVQAVQDQLNRNTRSRFDWWGGCLLLSAVVKCCRSCDDEVIVWSASSLFKLLKQSKAYLPTSVLTLVTADALFGPKMKGLNINCTSCVCFSFCFSTAIPGILLSFYQLITGKTHRKRRPVMNIPAPFLLGINRTSANMLWTALRRRAHEERHRGRRAARPIFGRGFSSQASSFIFSKTGSALGSCAHKLIFCYILLNASAAPSSVFWELCQGLMKQWPHSHCWLLALIISIEKKVFPLFSCEKRSDLLISTMTQIHVTS